jgi:hypothetical protein
MRDVHCAALATGDKLSVSDRPCAWGWLRGLVIETFSQAVLITAADCLKLFVQLTSPQDG